MIVGADRTDDDRRGAFCRGHGRPHETRAAIIAIAGAILGPLHLVGNKGDLALEATFRRRPQGRSEEHTSELQSLMRISYAVFCWKKKKKEPINLKHNTIPI